MNLSEIFKRWFGSGFSFYTSYDEYSSDEYMNNIYDNPAFSVPNAKKTAAIKVVEFGIYKTVKENREKVQNHILSPVFSMPNSLSTWGDFLEYVITWYESHDNGCLIEKVSTGALFKPILKIWNPNNFTIYVNGGEISRIEIINPSRVIYGDDIKNFLWIKQPNFLSEADNHAQNQIMTGRSKQRGIGLFATFLANAWRSNNSVVKNGNSRSGLYTSKKVLSPDERKEFKEKIAAQNSFRNKGKDLVLSGDVAFTPLDHTPKDTEWNTGDRAAYDRVAVANGVAPELVGSGESTYQNRKEARKELYNETIIPFCRDFCRRLNWFLNEFLKTGEYIDFDTGSIPALQIDIGDAIKGIETIKDRVTVNEYRKILSKMTDIPLDDDPDGDKILVQASSVPLDELSIENNPPEDAE